LILLLQDAIPILPLVPLLPSPIAGNAVPIQPCSRRAIAAVIVGGPAAVSVPPPRAPRFRRWLSSHGAQQAFYVLGFARAARRFEYRR
jgi:hypothetical protein